MMRMTPRVAAPRRAFLMLCAIAVCTIASCSGNRDRAATPSASAATPGASAASEAVVAESSSVAAPLVLPSQLYVERDAVIAARATGVLVTLTVDLGASVTANQVIGHVDDEAATLTLARTNVALDAAQKSASRARDMKKVNGIPDADVETAEQNLKLADVAKREAEYALTMTRVTAPFDGVVTARYVQPGRLVTAHDTLLRIAARGPHLARVRVPEASAMSLRVGTRVTVFSNSQRANGQRINARIVRVSPAIDAASGTREVVVQVTEPATTAGGAFLSGSSVTVELQSGTRRALTVPTTALNSGGYVLVMQGDRAVVRSVVAGATAGARVEIMSGLQAGERVRRLAPQ